MNEEIKNAPGREAQGASSERQKNYDKPKKDTNEMSTARVVGKSFTGAITPEELDPATLTISQDFAAGIEKKTTLKVPIARPNPQVWFTPSGDPVWRQQVAVLELKEDRDHYIVVPDLVPDLFNEIVYKLLVGCMTKQGSFVLWPIRLPGLDGKHDTWNASGLRAANDFAGRWIRLVANRELGAYDVIEPISLYPEPTWPADPVAEFRKAYRDRIINNLEHPVVRHLRGDA